MSDETQDERYLRLYRAAAESLAHELGNKPDEREKEELTAKLERTRASIAFYTDRVARGH